MKKQCLRLSSHAQANLARKSESLVCLGARLLQLMIVDPRNIGVKHDLEKTN